MEPRNPFYLPLPPETLEAATSVDEGFRHLKSASQLPLLSKGRYVGLEVFDAKTAADVGAKIAAFHAQREESGEAFPLVTTGRKASQGSTSFGAGGTHEQGKFVAVYYQDYIPGEILKFANDIVTTPLKSLPVRTTMISLLKRFVETYDQLEIIRLSDVYDGRFCPFSDMNNDEEEDYLQLHAVLLAFARRVTSTLLATSDIDVPVLALSGGATPETHDASAPTLPSESMPEKDTLSDKEIMKWWEPTAAKALEFGPYLFLTTQEQKGPPHRGFLVSTEHPCSMPCIEIQIKGESDHHNPNRIRSGTLECRAGFLLPFEPTDLRVYIRMKQTSRQKWVRDLFQKIRFAQSARTSPSPDITSANSLTFNPIQRLELDAEEKIRLAMILYAEYWKCNSITADAKQAELLELQLPVKSESSSGVGTIFSRLKLVIGYF